MDKRMDEQIRQKVFKRDKYTCRYCGNKSGPFQADHVYPYSKGGETTMENLVTACGPCNGSKHNRVGRWPKPIGYFDPKPHKPHINALTYFGISDLVVAFIAMVNGGGVYAVIAFVFGLVLSIAGLYTSFVGIEE